MFVNKETLKVVTDQEVINFYKHYGLSLVEETLEGLDEFLTASEQPVSDTVFVTEMDEDGNEVTVFKDSVRTPEPFPRPFIAADVPAKAIYQNYSIAVENGEYTVTVVHKPEAEIIALRKSAYIREADPLRTEADNEALYDGTEPDYTLWHAKVAEIKARYPKESSNA